MVIIDHFVSKKRVMQLVRGLHNLRPSIGAVSPLLATLTVYTVATRLSWQRLRERALELGVPSCVVIFEPQPREFFAPGHGASASGPAA